MRKAAEQQEDWIQERRSMQMLVGCLIAAAVVLSYVILVYWR